MGFYTDIDVDVWIPEENISKFEAEIENLRARGEGWFDYFYDIEVDENGFITFEEYTRKWYNPEPLYDLLAKYGAEGSIMCRAETGEWWGTVFKDGKWKEGDIVIQVE